VNVTPWPGRPGASLNLKPFSICAALKEGEIVGSQGGDLQRIRVPLTHSIESDVAILNTTKFVESNAVAKVRGHEFHGSEESHTRVGTA
jgi:hypothetical protein